jgi:hypothetical protein
MVGCFRRKGNQLDLGRPECGPNPRRGFHRADSVRPGKHFATVKALVQRVCSRASILFVFESVKRTACCPGKSGSQAITGIMLRFMEPLSLFLNECFAATEAAEHFFCNSSQLQEWPFGAYRRFPVNWQQPVKRHHPIAHTGGSPFPIILSRNLRFQHLAMQRYADCSDAPLCGVASNDAYRDS